MSKKPKPATVGTKIADEHAAKLTACGVRMLRDYWLARRIDATLRRSVKKERRRCSRIVVAYIGSEIGACEMLAKVRSGEAL